MNKYNVIITHKNPWKAEWADRAPDDDDRYASDSIIITAKGLTEKEMWANLSQAYDEWMRERDG